ncbi:MAG TPA: glycosyltransferase family 39 protein [Candidatus Moranbacteria bacterium]|nr:glycosyltransferase family 39 protein [Candidatus Moranbacteria bacterium]
MKNKVLVMFKNKYFLVFLAIMFLGIFLRAYHFSDWLHFELDQARDAKITDLAYREGVENLPLLGPKAAGTFLRLGPVFYYFNYLTVVIFGNNPAGNAASSLIFGVLSIVVFYFLMKRYFGEKISLLLALLFSSSIFLVVYSRFAWNPNPIPFFSLLLFLSLLKVTDKNEKRRGVWLVVSGFSLACVTHMHFLAFVSMPVITALFLLIKWPKIAWKYWLMSLMVIFLLYLPPIINDIATGGDNYGQFFKVAEGKSNKDDHNLPEKVIKNYKENSLGYFLILTGQGRTELPKVEIKNEVNLTCDPNCMTKVNLGMVALVVFTVGLGLMIFYFWKGRKNENNDFLTLSVLWFAVIFGLYTLIAFDISPRFWLAVSGLPFIFLGLFLKSLEDYSRLNKNLINILVFLLVGVLVFFNLWEVKKRFWQYANAHQESFAIETDKILKERTRVTLEQQYLIIDYIVDFYEKNKYPVYLNSDPQFRRSFVFHLKNKSIPNDDWRNAVIGGKVYAEGNYFLVYPTLSSWTGDVQKYENNYRLIDKKEFGTLTVFHLEPLPGAINSQRQEFEEDGKNSSAPGVPVRYQWDEIFNDDSETEEEN